MRNSLSLNYKSAALPAELCRHRPHTKAVYSEVDQEFPMAQLARRHPAVKMICGHTGGNWELGIRTIRDLPNLSCDLAGSDPTAGFVEMAVREVGAERVIYGSDAGGRSFASQLGKVMGAHIPEAARQRILGANLRDLMTPILHAKGIRL